MIDAKLFWETLLATLRGIIIRYSKAKKGKKTRERKLLEGKINKLDKIISSGQSTIENYTELVRLNEELIRLRKEDLNGAFIRSRADWLEHGEKPSRFFLNLENKNRVNKNIAEIKIDENTKITNQMQILEKVKEFYEELYKKPDQQINTDNIRTIPEKLTDVEQEALDSPLTKKEIDTALSQLKNNKSPGTDDYSAKFFKTFWPQIGHYFYNCVNQCFSEGNLTDSQTYGLITCLPKSGKARNLLKNWRPISLLNTTYKLISLCITNRMRPLLNRIISHEQKGFLKGRSIADCTRIMSDIIFECENKEINGLILLIDFQKAFDSLSWKFIKDSLKSFNFGPNFIKWIEMFQKGAKSKIILNGHLSDSFPLERGCRQGDPISPYLFILCSEFLTLSIKNDANIEGININNKEHKCSQYADDTSVFLKASEENLKRCLKKLHIFYQMSGLEININKTKVIRIGPIRETDRRYCRENDLEWVTEFVALGIKYNVLNMKDITIQNIEEKLDSMKKIIQNWLYRNITPIGRVCIAKSLILSKIIHILQALPTPPSKFLKAIENLLVDFIWKNKRHEIN